MPPFSAHIILVAGEASGDMHAAHLVEEIKKLDPQVTFSGLGGTKMQGAGVTLYEDLTKLAVIGFVEVLRHYAEIKRAFDLILEKIRVTKPACVILVDYPGFNMRLAREIKKLNIKVVYYISPQVWAWKENRVKTIQQITDKMLVLFEFEKNFYASRRVDVEFVGHPLVDQVQTSVERNNFLRSLGMNSAGLTIGLLPGSRRREIDSLLPVMLQAATLIKQKNPAAQFLLMKASTIDHQYLLKFLNDRTLPIKIVEDKIYDGINACDLCMVASGTATLETAILNKPMVVVYKTAWLTYFLARWLIRIPYIGLVNVVAGKKIVPECIQFEATPQRMARELENIMQPQRMTEIKKELERVKNSLGKKGASQRAAQAVMKFLNT